MSVVFLISNNPLFFKNTLRGLPTWDTRYDDLYLRWIQLLQLSNFVLVWSGVIFSATRTFIEAVLQRVIWEQFCEVFRVNAFEPAVVELFEFVEPARDFFLCPDGLRD